MGRLMNNDDAAAALPLTSDKTLRVTSCEHFDAASALEKTIWNCLPAM
ncbi:MAG: hypothetical protein NZ523_01865 [Elioraea sp.]|nr:hypothetical protein [Elioraea sp.]